MENSEKGESWFSMKKIRPIVGNGYLQLRKDGLMYEVRGRDIGYLRENYYPALLRIVDTAKIVE